MSIPFNRLPLVRTVLAAGLVFRMLLDILEGQALPTSDREQTFAQRFGDERRQFLKKMGSIKAPLKSLSLSPISSMALFCYTFVFIYSSAYEQAACLTYSYMQTNHSATATGFSNFSCMFLNPNFFFPI